MDHISDLGFDAVWISPIVENTEGGYHGYWAKNFEKVNPHFGSESTLKSLVSTAHNKGMAVIVDVVANHIGYVDDISEAYPFNDESHYHEDCTITDWEDPWQLENCRIFGLPDLAQENPFVSNYLLDWIQKMISEYGFDAIRIDTVKHVPLEFWAEFIRAANVFTIAEVWHKK